MQEFTTGNIPQIPGRWAGGRGGRRQAGRQACRHAASPQGHATYLHVPVLDLGSVHLQVQHFVHINMRKAYFALVDSKAGRDHELVHRSGDEGRDDA